jgi:tRNA threonylcarbamoyladenosine biosynthesis protein TsaB
MRLLALDTTTATCRAALLAGDQVLGEYAGDRARSLAEQLPGALLDLLRTSGLTLQDVDAYTVVSGPGSFTGLRIGIATVQGLAFVTTRPVVAVSALEILGQLASEDEPEGTRVAAWMDARRGEVFTAVYRVEGRPLFTRDRLTLIDPPAVGAPDVTLARWAVEGTTPTVLAGDAVAASCGERPPAARQTLVSSLAVAAGRVAVHRVEAGETCGPADLRPLYVRRPDAILARERSGASR